MFFMLFCKMWDVGEGNTSVHLAALFLLDDKKKCLFKMGHMPHELSKEEREGGDKCPWIRSL